MSSSMIHMFWVCSLLLCGGIQHVRGRPQPSAQDETQPITEPEGPELAEDGPIPRPDGSIPGKEETAATDLEKEDIKKAGIYPILKPWVILNVDLKLSQTGFGGHLEYKDQPIPGEDNSIQQVSEEIGSEKENFKEDGTVPILSVLQNMYIHTPFPNLWFFWKPEGASQPIPEKNGSITGKEEFAGTDLEKEDIEKAGIFPILPLWDILNVNIHLPGKWFIWKPEGETKPIPEPEGPILGEDKPIPGEEESVGIHLEKENIKTSGILPILTSWGFLNVDLQSADVRFFGTLEKFLDFLGRT